MISNLYFILFNTFWLLFITEHIGTTVKDEDQAQRIYASVMIISVVFGTVGMPLLGMFCDKVSPTISIPTAFFVRAIAMLLFMLVQDPTTVYSYLVSVFMIFGTIFEGIATVSMVFRIADREIRGVMSGLMNSTGYVGQLIFCLAGGFLFDYVSIYAPFVFVGACDVLFGITAIIAGRAGILTDDHAGRVLNE